MGKTELAKALAEFLFNDENLMTRIDMSEYQERHSVSRLVGAPPGYVGYDEGGQLTEAVRRKPYSVILLDEIEKAHPDVFNILLQVLDEGRLTDNKGRIANFRNTIIIMTSNMGSQINQDGFENLKDLPSEDLLEKIKDRVMDLLRKNIRPEFLNRVDDIVMFKPLTQLQVEEVVQLQIMLMKQTLKNKGVSIDITEPAVKWLAKIGFDPQYGARPVKRIIQKYIMNELSRRIIGGNIDKDKKVVIDLKNDQLIFEN